MKKAEITARIKILSLYQLALIRNAEDSEAADRELEKVTLALSKLHAMVPDNEPPPTATNAK